MKINFLKPNNITTRKPLIITASLLLLLALTTGVAFAWKNQQKMTAAKRETKANYAEKEAKHTKEPQTKEEVAEKKPEETQVAAAVAEKLQTLPSIQQKPAPVPTPVKATAPTKTATPVVTKTTTPIAPTAPTTPVGGVYSPTAAQAFVEAEIIRLVNAERARVGVGALTSVSGLSRAADIRVAEEAIPSFVGVNHTRPDGRSYATVFPEAGYTGYTAWGENLVWGYQSAFSYNQINLMNLANKMFTNWKNSPGHYANMINGKYNQTGVGVALINQSGRTYWFGIQEFARK